MKKALSLMLMAFMIFAVNASAEEAVKETNEHTTLDGNLVCLGCSLKKAEGARAACSAYGHKHVLQTKDGRYISFLENDFSRDLAAGEKYHNKDVTVSGIYHASANMLDVETFSVDGKRSGWCGHCSRMDGCPFKGHGEM